MKELKNIVIFGATRGVGLKAAEMALAKGHTVTLPVREPAKVADLKHENLTVVPCDVMDLESVEAVLRDKEAVLSAIGAPASDRRNKVRSEGTRNVIRAMEKLNIRRLISVSTLGVGDSRDA